MLVLVDVCIPRLSAKKTQRSSAIKYRLNGGKSIGIDLRCPVHKWHSHRTHWEIAVVQQFPIEQKDSRINDIGEMAWGLTTLAEYRLLAFGTRHFGLRNSPTFRDKKSRPEGRRLNIKPKLFRGATL